MRGVATDIGTIHFVGIGGIGMSGIAEVMHNLGYKVQGSDVGDSYVVEGLRKRGIPVTIGHAAENLGDAAVVVTSTAIKRGNPEVEAALERRVPLVRRAEMLAELMRLKSTVAVAGTHGKTTTTSMVAALLDAGGVDPTVINGGIINSYGSNARLGASEWMVVEADESDGSFLRLDGTIAVVTNIDPEHLDHYGGLRRGQGRVRRVRRERAVLRRGRDVRRPSRRAIDPAAAARSPRPSPTASRRRPTCARSTSRRWRAAAGSRRSCASATAPAARSRASRCQLPGRHNVQNALAAIGVALELGIPDATICTGFARFDGVQDAASPASAEAKGAAIIDDYAHHPVEIRAVLSAARDTAEGQVIAVVQPHRFTRLADLMEGFQTAFNDADHVYVTPVYAAGEAPLPGVDAAALVEGLKRRGHRSAATVALTRACSPSGCARRWHRATWWCAWARATSRKWAAGLPQAIDGRAAA